MFEYACHEGNCALQHILSGARAAERAPAAAVAAVFDAFRWIFTRKTSALRALGRRGEGPPAAELIDLLTGEAVRLARQFFNIVIRAVDYCPLDRVRHRC